MASIELVWLYFPEHLLLAVPMIILFFLLSIASSLSPDDCVELFYSLKINTTHCVAVGGAHACKTTSDGVSRNDPLLCNFFLMLTRTDHKFRVSHILRLGQVPMKTLSATHLRNS